MLPALYHRLFEAQNGDDGFRWIFHAESTDQAKSEAAASVPSTPTKVRKVVVTTPSRSPAAVQARTPSSSHHHFRLSSAPSLGSIPEHPHESSTVPTATVPTSDATATLGAATTIAPADLPGSSTTSKAPLLVQTETMDSDSSEVPAVTTRIRSPEPCSPVAEPLPAAGTATAGTESSLGSSSHGAISALDESLASAVMQEIVSDVRTSGSQDVQEAAQPVNAGIDSRDPPVPAAATPNHLGPVDHTDTISEVSSLTDSDSVSPTVDTVAQRRRRSKRNKSPDSDGNDSKPHIMQGSNDVTERRAAKRRKPDTHNTVASTHPRRSVRLGQQEQDNDEGSAGLMSDRPAGRSTGGKPSGRGGGTSTARGGKSTARGGKSTTRRGGRK